MCRSEDCAAAFIAIRNCPGALKKIMKRIDDLKLDESEFTVSRQVDGRLFYEDAIQTTSLKLVGYS